MVLGSTLTKVDNVLLMHVFDAFTDLSHVVDHLGLRHGVALSCDPLKEFTTRQAIQGEREDRLVQALECVYVFCTYKKNSQLVDDGDLHCCFVYL